ncbi:hypothetical protein D3C85_1732640 [compost metagenome]
MRSSRFSCKSAIEDARQIFGADADPAVPNEQLLFLRIFQDGNRNLAALLCVLQAIRQKLIHDKLQPFRITLNNKRFGL